MKGYALAFLLIAGCLPAVSDDLEDSIQRLKEAESKKDVDLIKKLAGETCTLARQAASAPAPEGQTEKEYWTKRVAYARELELYSEYALSAAAVQASTPAVTVDLLATLEKQNPSSKYLDENYARYLLALNQTGASSTIPAVVERGLKYLPNNEDLLIVAADNAINRKQPDRALGYAERLIAVVGKHSKPEGMSQADWDRKRDATVGRARWIAGVIHGEKGQHFEADKDLRIALPLVRSNESMAATALFYLGIANYQLGSATRDRARVLEAAKFSEQAAAIKGPLSQQAWRNAQAMKAEAVKIR